MGDALTTETKTEKVIFFHGTNGKNGKSTLLDIIRTLLGKENVSNIALEQLNDKFQLSQIVDKLANIADESNHNVEMDTSLLKRISSGNIMQMDKKYQQPYSFKPYATLFFSFNTLPRTRDTDGGWRRRMLIIPFNYEPEIKNTSLSAELREELDGILAFAIRGLKRLRKNNYQYSYCKIVEKERNAYFAKNDICENLLNKCIRVVHEENAHKKHKIIKKDLYTVLMTAAPSAGHKEIIDEPYKDIMDKIQYILKERGIYQSIQPAQCFSHHVPYFPCVKFTEQGKRYLAIHP
jgi:putative DNA primase/helicase